MFFSEFERVEHRLDPPEGAAADDHIAWAERTLADHQFGHDAAAFMHLGF